VPDDPHQYEPKLPEQVRRAAERANELARALQPQSGDPKPPSRQPDHRDPVALRTEATQHQQKAARLQGIIDGLQREADAHLRAALGCEDQAQVNERTQTVVPFGSRRWGRLVAVPMPSERDIERSADPDTVEREGAEIGRAEVRDARARPVVENARATGEASRAAVEVAGREEQARLAAGRKGKVRQKDIERAVHKRTGLSETTIRRYKPKQSNH
jgi:hypothetical protein